MRPPVPSSEIQKPKESVATIRDGPTVWLARATSVFASAIRTRHPPVESGRGVVVPSRTVASGELPMHCVPQSDLQTLQGSVEGGTDGRVPSVEMKCFLTVSLHGSEVRAHAFWRERCLQVVQNVSVGEEGLDFSPWSRCGHDVRPGSASAFLVCARGLAFSASSCGDGWSLFPRTIEYPGLATAFRLAFAVSSTSRNWDSGSFRRCTSPERLKVFVSLPL